MKFSKHVMFMLLLLLIILNLVLRFPVTPNETGNDSFYYHTLANSISSFGHAKWLIHPLSIFGLYPYSDEIAGPLEASIISQCIGIGMEWTIWLFSVFLGVLSIFTAYLLAGEIKKGDDIFKFLVAFGFSTSQSMLCSTTWCLSTRGLFLVLLPLFIYLMLKSRTFKLRYGILSLVFFMLLAATHHFFILTIPIIAIYFAILIVYKLKLTHNKVIGVPKRFPATVLLTLFVVLFMLSFYIQNPLVQAQASTVSILKSMIFVYARYIGVLGIFAILGFFFLLFKQKKSFEEWFLLLILLYITPLLIVTAYMKQFSAIFIFLLAGMGMLSLARAPNQKRRTVFSIILISLLLSVAFSGFYQCKSTNIEQEFSYFKPYMTETEYASALWLRNNVSVNDALVCNDYLLARRTLAISEVPVLTGRTSDLVYDFISKNDLKVKMTSPTSYKFYTDYAFELEDPSSSTNWHLGGLLVSTNTEKWEKRMISDYGISHVIENENIYGRCCRGGGIVRNSPFFESLHEKKTKVYSNAHITIWVL